MSLSVAVPCGCAMGGTPAELAARTTHGRSSGCFGSVGTRYNTGIVCFTNYPAVLHVIVFV